MADILIVDTQAALRQQLVKLMQDMGHRAMVVATIAEASRILQEAPPDLVATDVTLTDGSSTWPCSTGDRARGQHAYDDREPGPDR